MTANKPPSLDRKNLTFAQAEGVEPLPAPLALKEVSRELRVVLWRIVHESIDACVSYGEIGEPWLTILKDKHVFHDHRMIHAFSASWGRNIAELSELFGSGDYIAIFGALQFMLRHDEKIKFLARDISAALERCQAAYRLVDGDTFVPIATPEEGKALAQALSDLDNAKTAGARRHLLDAGAHLSSGRFNDSVRESIHAVESVARSLDPKASSGLAPALAQLETKGAIHGALKSGFNAIYGYTSDEEGIRHALIKDPKSPADMHDALFMIGACASFITYMLGKAHAAGIKLR